jgi:arylsulfatase A-like enzyme
VILIFSDDQRFNTIRALGNGEIQTPNLDRLVAEGTSFTRAYMMGSMTPATCVPSRAMLLSGRSLFQIDQNGRNIPPEHVTIPEALKLNGYDTYWVGKSHQTQSTMGRIFDGGDRNYGYHGPFRAYDHYLMAVHDFDPEGKFTGPLYIYRRGADGEEIKTEVNEEIFAKMKEVEDKESAFFHTSEVFSIGAVNFLKDYDDEQPFFMYLAYHAPHDPRNAPKLFHEMYPPDKTKLPPNFMKKHPFDQGALELRDERLARLPREESEIRQHLSDYYAIISHMDEQIGRVLETLKETGLEKNTIVIFTSDSGLAVGNHGLMGKQNLYDAGGVHVPLIFRGPGIPKGETRDAKCYTFDVMPTICEMTGSVIPGSCEGKSLAGIVHDDMGTTYDYLYFAYSNTQRAIQGDRYKLIEYEYKGKRHTQLFDLKVDIDEVKNQAQDPNSKEIIVLLREKMSEYSKMFGDNLTFGRTH